MKHDALIEQDLAGPDLLRRALDGMTREQLLAEKFLHFLEVAETDREWRQAIPAFVAELEAMFEPWQLAEFLNTPRRLGALGHASTEEGHRRLRAEWNVNSIDKLDQFCALARANKDQKD